MLLKPYLFEKKVTLGDGVSTSQQISIVYGKKGVFYEGLVPFFAQVGNFPS